MHGIFAHLVNCAFIKAYKNTVRRPHVLISAQGAKK